MPFVILLPPNLQKNKRPDNNHFRALPPPLSKCFLFIAWATPVQLMSWC
jgi:hypothetical protein